MPIVRKIKTKKCINMDDYQELLNEKLFYSHLKRYFRDRVHYRDLMQSRIGAATKADYFKRIDVFEQAFEDGVFEKIN